MSAGITVVCDTAEARFLARRARGEPLLLTLDNARVVQGTSVVTTVAQAVEEEPETGDLALVPVRILCLGDAPADFVSSIIQAGETESPADLRDLVALDPIQLQLREEFADELDKEYVYKADAAAPAPNGGCTMQEAAVALACAHPDVSLTARASADPAYLWRPAPDGAYTRLFGGRPSARQIWQCVLLLRQVRSALAYAATGEARRARDLAKHGELLIAHLIFRSVGPERLDELDESADRLEDWVTYRTWETADLVASAAERLYGQHLFLASVFTDERKCHVLADDVTRSLTAPAGLSPITSSGGRRRPNSVVALVEHHRIPDGTRVLYRPGPVEERAIGDWLSEDPRRYLATWTNDSRRPLIWEVDGRAYSPTALVLHIFSQAAWNDAPAVFQGARHWVIPSEGTLADLAAALTPPTRNGGA